MIKMTFKQQYGSLQRFMSCIRFRPFAMDTLDGRSKERIRRAALTASTAALARLIAMSTPLITIPLTLHYLGLELYGLWMTVTSVIGMFVFADLGLGSGLVTNLSRAQGRNDSIGKGRLVSTTAFLLLGMALILGIGFAVAWPLVPWSAILNAHSQAAVAAAGGIVAAYAFCFLVGLPLTTVQRTQMALQEGFQSNLWQCGGSFLGLVAVLLVIKLQLSPPWFVLFVSCAPLLVTAGNWWWFFYRLNPGLRPRWKAGSLEDAQVLLRTGGGFFLISILTSIGLYADNLIVAHQQDLRSVTVFSIASRVMLIVTAVVNMICAPMWAANGEALARGEVAWVRRTTTRLMWLSCGATTVVAVLMAVLGPFVLRLWLGPEFTVSRFLLTGLGLGVIAISVSAPYFMVLNGAGVILPQVKLFLVFAPVTICAKIILGHIFGSTGIALGGALCYACIIVPSVFCLSRRVLRPSLPQFHAGD